MLKVERLAIHLPAGYEHSHDEVLQLVAAELARLRLDVSGRIEALRLPPIEVEAGCSNRQLAERIGAAIRSGIEDALPAATRLQTKGGQG